MIIIKNLTKEEIISFLLANGEKKSRAVHIMDGLWKKGYSSFDEMTNLAPEIIALLKKHFIFNNLTIDLVKRSADTTIKVAFRLFDGKMIEGVIIPSLERTTACISTQVGCAVGCSFCATGTLGISRNLTHSEIYDQVLQLNRLSIESFGHPLNNIVMMGMGEPLMNYENVMQSIECLTANWGLSFSHNRITVSTSGITENIKRLADDGFKCQLAISLHSADNTTRSKLMKINNTSNLTVLSDAISYYYTKTGRTVTFEYLLLQGFNDSIEDAQKLVSFCQSFPCKVNIISYNETEKSLYKRCTEEQTQLFVRYLITHKLIVTLRASKGQDIDAACGQLANRRKAQEIEFLVD